MTKTKINSATKYAIVGPRTPGATPSIVALAHSISAARRIAEETFGDRRDLRYCDVRIERPSGALAEYAGPFR